MVNVKYKSMAKVHEEYSKLESVISDIGLKVSDALNGQETEFLSVYKSIMDSAQIKVRDIKQDIEQKEKAIYDHVKVKELEKERDWYRQEALNLDKLLTESKKRETDLKERLDEVSSDRKWLSDQVKALMKRKAVLEEQVSQSKE